MNIWATYIAENFLTSLSRKTLLHAVSWPVTIDDNMLSSPNLYAIRVCVYQVRLLNINIYTRTYCQRQKSRDKQILLYPWKEICTGAYKPTGWVQFQHKSKIHIFITN